MKIWQPDYIQKNTTFGSQTIFKRIQRLAARLYSKEYNIWQQDYIQKNTTRLKLPEITFDCCNENNL